MSHNEFYSLHVIRESEDMARQCIDRLLGLPRTDIDFDRVPIEAYTKRLEILAVSYRVLPESERALFHYFTLADLDWLITRLEDVYENVTEYGTERFEAWMINRSMTSEIANRLLERKAACEMENGDAETH